jgi:hypothetical protein
MATPAQWQRIIAAKKGPCRVCCDPTGNGHEFGRVEFHHLIAKGALGDDVADNIVPLHALCHELVTRRAPAALQALARSLTDAEYAYVIGKLGEGALERLFGVNHAGI